MEITEFASADTNIRNIDITVDLPCNRIARYVFAAQHIGNEHQLFQRGSFIDEKSFFSREWFEPEGLLIYFVAVHIMEAKVVKIGRLKKKGADLSESAPFCMIVRVGYAGWIASTGHTSAQVPHSVHISGLME